MRRRCPVWSIALLLLCAGAARADEGAAPAWPELKRRTAVAFARPGALPTKRAVLRQLADTDEAAAWMLLLAALEQEGRHLDRLAREREEAWAAVRVLWSLPRPQHHAGTVQRLRRAFDALADADRRWFRERMLVGQMGARLAGAPAAARALYRREATAPVPLLHPTARAALAPLLADGLAEAEGVADYRTLLERDEDPEVRLAAMRALPAEGRTVLPLLLRRLRDPSWVVRVAAARTLAERGATEARGMLEDALGRAGPREAVALRAALRELGVRVEIPSWQGPSLFGAPLPSDRVVFVLDASAAMDEDFERAREEVAEAIRALPADGVFGLVVYHGAVMPWREAPAPATSANKQAAIRWLADHEPQWISCMDGGLREAFRIAGLAPPRGEAGAIDTIALLAAGRPSAYGARKPTPLREGFVERLVQVWNRDGRVRLQCVSLGTGAARPVLEQLSRDHEGGAVTTK